MSTVQDRPVCPDCGKQAHNPRTGLCWKVSERTNPSSKNAIHCAHCCIRREVTA